MKLFNLPTAVFAPEGEGGAAVATPPAPVITPAAADSLAAKTADPAPDPKPADPAAPEPKPGEPEKKPAEGEKKADAPVVFDPKAIKIPEGFTVDEAKLTALTEVLNDTKLDPQARGQKLVEMYSEAVKQVSEANTKAWETTNAQWLVQIKADAEIGGDKLPATQQSIAKMIDLLGPERATAFRESLNLTGAGNNPAIVKGMAWFASKLTEGGHVAGTPATKPDLAKTFFPNSPDMR